MRESHRETVTCHGSFRIYYELWFATHVTRRPHTWEEKSIKCSLFFLKNQNPLGWKASFWRPKVKPWSGRKKYWANTHQKRNFYSCYIKRWKTNSCIQMINHLNSQDSGQVSGFGWCLPRPDFVCLWVLCSVQLVVLKPSACLLSCFSCVDYLWTHRL